MKKTNLYYWIITLLFAAFMIFSSLPDALSTEQAVTFITHLGYPEYFIPFIGVAKLLGVIAIVIPGFPRIKEWAYAGIAFDLIGAIYSIVAVDGWNSGILFMILPLGFLTASYLLYHKKNNHVTA